MAVSLSLCAALASGCGDGGGSATLPAATGLTVAVTTMQATLSWEPVAGAASYNVYWSNASGVTPASGTKVVSAPRPFVHSGLANGRTYYYVVTAVDRSSREGAASAEVSAAPQEIGSVDATLSDGSNSGFVVYAQGSQSGGESVLGLPNEEILAIGYVYGVNNDMAIRKYKGDGSLDTGFGTAGQVTFDRGPNDYPSKALIDPSGKILITGYSSMADADMIIWRYDPDGTPDSSFGNGGVVIYDSGGDDYGSAIALDADGDIFVSGNINGGSHSDLAVWEYDSHGALVASFGVNGHAIVATGHDSFANALAVTGDGIYVAGSDGSWGNSWAMLVKLDRSGNADASFGTGGRVVTPAGGNDEFRDMAIDGSGRIVLAGRSGSDMALWRYDGDGTPDGAFGGGGKASYSSGAFYSLALDPAGRILAAGGNSLGFPDSRFAVARYDQNGTIDGSFGVNGLAVLDNGQSSYGNDLAFDSMGRLLLIGTTYSPTPSLMICRFK